MHMNLTMMCSQCDSLYPAGKPIQKGNVTPPYFGIPRAASEKVVLCLNLVIYELPAGKDLTEVILWLEKSGLLTI